MKKHTIYPTLSLLLGSCLVTQAATTYISEDFEGFSSGSDFEGYSNLPGTETADTPSGEGISGFSAGQGFSDSVGGTGGQAPLEIVGTNNAANDTINLDLNSNGIYWTFTATADTQSLLSYDTTTGGNSIASFWRLYDGNGTGGTVLENGQQEGGTTSGVPLTLTEGSEYTLALGSVGEQTNNGAHIDNVSLSAVPEPSAALLGGFGILALMRRRQR